MIKFHREDGDITNAKVIYNGEEITAGSIDFSAGVVAMPITKVIGQNSVTFEYDLFANGTNTTLEYTVRPLKATAGTYAGSYLYSIEENDLVNDFVFKLIIPFTQSGGGNLNVSDIDTVNKINALLTEGRLVSWAALGAEGNGTGSTFGDGLDFRLNGAGRVYLFDALLLLINFAGRAVGLEFATGLIDYIRTANVLEIRRSVPGDPFEVVRAADAVGQDDLVNLRTLQAQAILAANSQNFTSAEKQKLASLDTRNGAPVQNLTELTAIPIADLSDKEKRFVEDAGSDYYFDAQAIAGDAEPNDKANPGVGPSYWIQLAGGGSETPASVKAKYESNPDTEGYTTAEKAKVAAIEAGATQNSTDAALRDRSTPHRQSTHFYTLRF